MIHLIYVSSASREMSEEDLVALLQQCRLNNQKKNVTGMLLYSEGNFFQILEGEEKDVMETYREIVNDRRNTGHIILEKENITERTFPDWAMGFKQLAKEKAPELAGYTRFLDTSESSGTTTKQSSDLTVLLNIFKNNI